METIEAETGRMAHEMGGLNGIEDVRDLLQKRRCDSIRALCICAGELSFGRENERPVSAAQKATAGGELQHPASRDFLRIPL